MITIQKIKPEEISAAKKLLYEAWMDTYSVLYPTKVLEQVAVHWHDPQKLLQEAQSPHIYFAVAKDEKGAICGLITVLEKEEGVIIDRLYIHPASQRRGIGSQFLENLYEIFPSSKYWLTEVEKSNNKGMQFWLKQGFVEMKTKHEDFFGFKTETVIMEKQLRK